MLYERIRELCEERGLTIAGLEKAVGLGNATIRGWKQSSPRVLNLKAVADYFAVSLDDLLKGGIE